LDLKMSHIWGAATFYLKTVMLADNFRIFLRGRGHVTLARVM
jgi:hypothetical protein